MKERGREGPLGRLRADLSLGLSMFLAPQKNLRRIQMDLGSFGYSMVFLTSTSSIRSQLLGPLGREAQGPRGSCMKILIFVEAIEGSTSCDLRPGRLLNGDFDMLPNRSQQQHGSCESCGKYLKIIAHHSPPSFMGKYG